MQHTDLPRSPAEAARTATREQPGIQEPPTGRALWPTFMRRTLAEEEVYQRHRSLLEADAATAARRSSGENQGCRKFPPGV